MLQEVPLPLSFLGGSVIVTNCTCVLQVQVLSPCSRDEVMVLVSCTVELLVLESRVPYAHQIVQDNASFHDDFDSRGVMLNGGQQNLSSRIEELWSRFSISPKNQR